MARTGVSKPYYALYNANGNTVTYSDGGLLGRITSVNLSINTSMDNDLYADNGIAETDRQFTSGTLTVGTDELSQEVSKVIVGAEERPLGPDDGVTVPEGGTAPTELVFGDNMTFPYLGVGFVIKGQYMNRVYWRAVVLTKVMFAVPNDAVTTQGKTIDWQTPELTATILRDDTDDHFWKRESTFDTEAKAEGYIKAKLNITANTAVVYKAPRSTAKI